MRLGRLLIILAVILLIGVAVVYVFWQFVVLPRSTAATPVATPTIPPVEILMFAQSVSQGTILESSMLVPVPWQQNLVAPGMVKASELANVVGLVVKYDIQQGTPLLYSMLLSEGETLSSAGSPWALSIPPGMVAVSIPINRLTSVSYAIRPGDHVDVIASLLMVDVDTDFQAITPNQSGVVTASGPPDPTSGEHNPLTVAISNGIYGRVIIDPVLNQAVYLVPGEAQRPRMVSHMLLQDVVVLQTGDFPLESKTSTTTAPAGQPTPVPTPTAAGQAPPPPPLPNVITLIVRPQDAVALNFILLGQPQMATMLNLALRGANDASRENILPVTLGFLLEQYQIPIPAKVPYSLGPRIDSLSPVPLPVTQPTQ
jgi:Flp pilus assembly protein CpaB